ncbi:coumarin 8-geranyltransferase 1b, chloroplastic-like [Citrus clementina]|uniref:coumarin 8-geranyltransferase 1b, chloroplastic-like n=1 Tax=Citrus clementina TaxID=85681 RepID=UPI000CECEBA7|nr:coumarin 8-geranyltransferase 1b, chloroplastic-like [Citrus x clementina]
MLQMLAISSFSPKYHPYVQHSRCVKTHQPPATHIHGVLNSGQGKKYAVKCSENSFYPTNKITERNDVVYKPFSNNDHFPAVTLQDGYASKSEDGDENSKNVLLKNLNALYRFIYPYACFGLLIATTSNSLLPVEKLADLTPTFFIGLLKPLVLLLLMNIYGAAVNQVADVELSKVNKTYMPLASGEFSMETGIAITWISALMVLASAIMLRSPPLVLGVIVWLFISTAYSAQLPFLRWKGNSFLASVCAVFMCGLIPQVPFFFHVQKYVLGRPMEVTKPLMFASAFITFISLAIAFVKVSKSFIKFKHTISVILGKAKVLWLSVYMLSIAYGAAVLFGASSSFLLSKLVTIIGHPTLLLFLRHRARNVDLSNNASIFSFYMFIWQLYYAKYLLIPFVAESE